MSSQQVIQEDTAIGGIQSVNSSTFSNNNKGKPQSSSSSIPTSNKPKPTSSPSPSPSSPPPPASPPTINQNTKSNIGPDGVLQLYPTLAGGTEWFQDIQSAQTTNNKNFNISFGTGSHLPSTKKTEGGLTFFNTKGSPVNYASGSPSSQTCRFDIYPDGGMWSNKSTNSWQNNPGYLYTEKGFKNHEITAYIRPHGQKKTHEAFAFKLQGRDEDAIRSLVEMVYPTASHPDVTVNFNYSHFPYVPVSNVKQYFSGDRLTDGKWVGVKVVYTVADDKKSATLKMYVDLDPFDSVSGKPQNNWKLKAECTTSGVSAYKNVPPTWRCHKQVIRVDGFDSVDFTLFSDREIDISGKDTANGNINKAPIVHASPGKVVIIDPNVTTNNKPKSKKDDGTQVIVTATSEPPSAIATVPQNPESGDSAEELAEAIQWVKDNPKTAKGILEDEDTTK